MCGGDSKPGSAVAIRLARTEAKLISCSSQHGLRPDVKLSAASICTTSSHLRPLVVDMLNMNLVNYQASIMVLGDAA